MTEPTLKAASDGQGSAREEFWKAYYDGVHAQPNPWLDASNHRVQLQGLAAALEAAGGVLGRTCLDAGCGRGQFSLALQAFGAAAVTGLEVNESTVQLLRATHPTCRWIQGSIADPAVYAELGRFDLVFAMEVLQYVALDSCLDLLWSATRPGGRLIALAPHRDCPIVQKTVEKFSGRYGALSIPELRAALSSLPDLDFWACRGFSFRADQTIAPYDLSPWTAEPTWEGPPNRLMFIAQRASEAHQ